MKKFWMALFLILALPVMFIRAQEPPSLPLPLAVEYQNKQYVITKFPQSAEDLPAVLTIISEQPSDSLDFGAIWSPDGKKLAYHGNLIWDGSKTIELNIPPAPTFLPISWTHDGRILYVKFSGENTAIDYLARFYTVAPEVGATPELVADGLPVTEGCGVGTELPMEGRLWREVGISKTRPLLALTEYGLVYPAGCLGSTISLYRPATGENFILANGLLNQAVLSPDRSRLAGIVYDSNLQASTLVLIDLLTLAETTLATAEPPAVVAWGKDGSLYYAAASYNRSLLDSLAPEKRILALSVLPPLVATDFTKANSVHLYRRDANGTETLLHQQDAYAVGKLFYKDNTLIYSTIANGDAWVQAMGEGKLTSQNVFYEAAYAYMSTAVNYITFNADGSIALTGTLPGDLQRVAVSNE